MIFLSILKIIGLVLAGIVAFVLLMVLLVLFAPFRYRLSGMGANEDAGGNVAVKWLFGFLTVRAEYAKKKFSYYVRVCGIKVFKGEMGLDSIEKKDDEKKEPEETEEPEEKGSLYDRIVAKLEKLKETWNKVKEVKYILTAPITERAWEYTKVRLKKLICHIRPRSMKGRIEFGTEDPANTALIYGASAGICQMIDERLLIVPDMEEKTLDMDFSISGRFFVGYMLLLALQIVTNKNVRRVIGYTKKNLQRGH